VLVYRKDGRGDNEILTLDSSLSTDKIGRTDRSLREFMEIIIGSTKDFRKISDKIV
jgi:hypothetical protein